MAIRRSAFGKAQKVRADTARFDSMPRNSEKIWDSVKAKVGRGRAPTPLAAMQKLYGKGRGGKGVNTKAAAQDLGVSQRTVQRWVKDRRTPKSEAGARLTQQYQAWQNTPRGRASALGRRHQGAVREAKRFTITCTVKISTDVGKRTNMAIDIADDSRGDWNLMVDHMIAGDDAGMHDYLERVTGQSGFGGDVEIKGIEFFDL